MYVMEFEWDSIKNQRNIEKHGIDFTDAVRIFEHPTLTVVDNRRDYGEKRIAAMGLSRMSSCMSSTLLETAFGVSSQQGEQIVVKEKNTLSYSLNNLPKDSQTDWEHLKNMTESEIEAAAASDPDAQPTDEAFWANAEVMIPQPKRAISLRVDNDVLEWFKSHGSGYQTRMNAVLRAYMEAQQS